MQLVLFLLKDNPAINKIGDSASSHRKHIWSVKALGRRLAKDNLSETVLETLYSDITNNKVTLAK